MTNTDWWKSWNFPIIPSSSPASTIRNSQSAPNRAHPLFSGLVSAALEHKSHS